jgi:MFS family permease
LLRTLKVMGQQLLGRPLSPEDVRQVIVLCACHAVMGWGFFLLQNWLPLYLASLGPQALVETGRLSSMPWLAAALVGMLMGSASDGLIQWGLPILSVRRLMQCISFFGCALAVLPLALHPQPGLGLATACLTTNLAAYSVSYGGFHAYLQDVAGKRAGVLQGLTNSCSILTGIAGRWQQAWDRDWGYHSAHAPTLAVCCMCAVHSLLLSALAVDARRVAAVNALPSCYHCGPVLAGVTHSCIAAVTDRWYPV